MKASGELPDGSTFEIDGSWAEVVHVLAWLPMHAATSDGDISEYWEEVTSRTTEELN